MLRRSAGFWGAFVDGKPLGVREPACRRQACSRCHEAASLPVAARSQHSEVLSKATNL